METIITFILLLITIICVWGPITIIGALLFDLILKDLNYFFESPFNEQVSRDELDLLELNGPATETKKVVLNVFLYPFRNHWRWLTCAVVGLSIVASSVLLFVAVSVGASTAVLNALPFFLSFAAVFIFDLGMWWCPYIPIAVGIAIVVTALIIGLVKTICDLVKYGKVVALLSRHESLVRKIKTNKELKEMICREQKVESIDEKSKCWSWKSIRKAFLGKKEQVTESKTSELSKDVMELIKIETEMVNNKDMHLRIPKESEIFLIPGIANSKEKLFEEFAVKGQAGEYCKI